MVAVAHAKDVIFEVCGNYQKQSYRNRAYIAHSNGKLLLNVPIKHTKDGQRQKTIDVKVENNFPWINLHWKSIQNAYRTSPFFEFYEDDLAPIFHNPVEHLLEHNLKIFDLLTEFIGIEVGVSKTTNYEHHPSECDLRFLAESKKEKNYPLEPYTQVLEASHGFLPNLSVLDLIFNEGPNSLNYLESQKLPF